ncbi:GNAT family N-acetyltransferase [Cohnella suwonensis]|uniref:GNAT family N-acetyltransferase n=1 Tax=Cohnella suwonensis TaxID=696072 RepID=A0ABW0LWQ7_9BACL
MDQRIEPSETIESMLRKAMQDHYLSYLESLSLPEFSVETVDGATMLSSAFVTALSNRVLKTRTSEESLPALLANVVGRYRSRNVPFMWTAWPADLPTSLPERLKEHGFSGSAALRGMALETGRPRTGEEPPLPEGFSIERVDTREDMMTFASVAQAGYGFDEEATKGIFHLLSPLVAEGDKGSNFVGRMNGMAVATSSLIRVGDVAGIYYVSTLPEARGLGAGIAVTRRAIAEAEALGCRWTILHASDMGYPLYAKLGFFDIGVMERFTLK